MSGSMLCFIGAREFTFSHMHRSRDVIAHHRSATRAHPRPNRALHPCRIKAAKGSIERRMRSGEQPGAVRGAQNCLRGVLEEAEDQRAGYRSGNLTIENKRADYKADSAGRCVRVTPSTRRLLDEDKELLESYCQCNPKTLTEPSVGTYTRPLATSGETSAPASQAVPGA
jgi:hypothetical protein